MPTPDERILALERAVRLLNREMATSRALYLSSVTGSEPRIEAVESKLDTLAAELDHRFDAVDQRFDGMQADINALLDSDKRQGAMLERQGADIKLILEKLDKLSR